MTIYLAFNENEALSNISADVTNITASSATIISGVNRAAVQLVGGVICEAELSTPIDEGWLHARVVPRYGSSVAGSAANYFLSLLDEDDNQIAGFYQNKTNNGGVLDWWATYFGDPNFGVASATDTGTLIGVNSSSGYDVDINFKIANTGGFIRWYVGGTLIREFLGDTQTGSSSLIAKIRLRALGGGITASHWLQISQVIVSDEPTIGARLHTLALGTASTNDWDGTLSDVTGTTYASTTTLSTDVAGDEVICATGDIGSINSGNEIKAVIVSTAALSIPGSPVTQLRGTAVVSGTPYNTADVALPAAFAPVRHIFETNPATAAKWTLAQVNAAEFGFEARA